MKKTKTVRTYSSMISREDTEYLSSYIEYDEHGNVVLAETYMAEDEIESKNTYLYDEKGRLVEEVNYISIEEFGEKLSYIRDDDGKITAVEVTYGDGSMSFRRYERDVAEKTLTITITDDDGESEGSETIKFNDNDLMVEKTVVNEDNVIEEHIRIEYDSENKIVKECEYESGDRLMFENLYKYDETGKLILRVKVNRKRELIEKVEINYDERGNAIEQKYGDMYLIKRAFDDNGNVVKEERFNALGIMESITESVFDETGLLVEETGLTTRVRYEYEFFE
ncbi:MAG: hypothetical protein KJ607_07860 [Bacteroidetes bacterium]|nr:hypothetical protein [Bacteroidota bacterium]